MRNELTLLLKHNMTSPDKKYYFDFNLKQDRNEAVIFFYLLLPLVVRNAHCRLELKMDSKMELK